MHFPKLSDVKFSWTSLKISIAGARLSHLVQKDPIWDHGTMIEFVKIVFYQVQKVNSDNTEIIKKYLTAGCYEKLMKQPGHQTRLDQICRHSTLKQIAILKVKPVTGKHPDLFTALVSGYKMSEAADSDNTLQPDEQRGKNEFSDRWTFVRQGDWWLLDRSDKASGCYISN